MRVWGQDKTDSLHFCTDWGEGAKENLWAQETTRHVMYVQRNMWRVRVTTAAVETLTMHYVFFPPHS
jgi:hypothetical protein